MLKKLLTITLLSVGAFFGFSSTVSAQGQFICTWTGSECDADTSHASGSNGCEAGYWVDEAYCDQFTEDSSCFGGTAACVQDTAPTNDGWQCVSAGTPCAPCNIASNPVGCLADVNACNAACDPADPTPTYVCENNACVAQECDPADAGCYANAAMCQGVCFPPDDDPGETSTFRLCEQISNPDLRTKCLDCAGDTPDDPQGVWTAVGCINRRPENIIASLITIGLGMGGGIALLMILGASFMLTTSQGDPKRTGEAKEMITAALIGLVFVIFSVTILQFIGFTILRIPGFGG